MAHGPRESDSPEELRKTQILDPTLYTLRVRTLGAGTGHLHFTGHAHGQGRTGLSLSEITNILQAWEQRTYTAPEDRELGPQRWVQKCSPESEQREILVPGLKARLPCSSDSWVPSRVDLCPEVAFPGQLPGSCRLLQALCSHTDLNYLREPPEEARGHDCLWGNWICFLNSSNSRQSRTT